MNHATEHWPGAGPAAVALGRRGRGEQRRLARSVVSTDRGETVSANDLQQGCDFGQIGKEVLPIRRGAASAHVRRRVDAGEIERLLNVADSIRSGYQLDEITRAARGVLHHVDALSRRGRAAAGQGNAGDDFWNPSDLAHAMRAGLAGGNAPAEVGEDVSRCGKSCIEYVGGIQERKCVQAVLAND